MLRVVSGGVIHNCAGMTRRAFLQVGTLGALGLLPAAGARGSVRPRARACILIWLDGGPPQHETYDPKPDAPAEIRGAYGAIETTVTGLRLSELLPLHARVAHRMAFLRSVYHDNGDHFAGAHVMLTGRWGATGADTTPRAPSFGSFVARARGAGRPDLPAYVGLPAIHSVGLRPGYHGAHFLGAEFDPFLAEPDASYGPSEGPRVGTPAMFAAATNRVRLGRRARMLDQVDAWRRANEADRVVAASDHYTRQALNTLLNPAVREAFDLDAEPQAIADRYGPSPWSRYCLLARRLVERGVTFVTVNFPDWDLHDNIAALVKPRCAVMDRAVSSLVTDLHERGLLEEVLVVVMGEFGRTPRLNQHGVPGATGIPGRDHWGQVMSVALAGGGVPGGIVVGASNAGGEYPVESPCTPQDLLATLYRLLGVDPHREYPDREGRPTPVLPGGTPIRELV